MATLPNVAPTPASATRVPTAMYNTRFGAPAGNISNTGNTALLGDDPNLSATSRLDTLLRSDNPLLAMARGRAGNYAAARGAGVDSASYAYNAEQGLGQQLIPLASEDAQRELALQQGNQDSLNRMALQREQSRATLGAAQISRASAMDQLRAANDYDTTRRAQDREWQVADQGTAARASARGQFFGALEGAMFSDPSVWRDPQGVIGAFNEYGTNFDAFFDATFPEYAQMQEAGGVPAGGGP